ncbi:hypothetical protein [Cellulomonas sp. NPDC089187]|uniref:hypothetical protein n=1 Tax=Cellulomonas sp. NPDC089187 TaxID=3154970 RepID=UPI00342185C7
MYEVSFAALRNSGWDWSDQRARVRSANVRLAEAPVNGFGAAVRVNASAWLASWSETVEKLATSAELIEQQLQDAADEYGTADAAAEERFEQWLWGTP